MPVTTVEGQKTREALAASSTGSEPTTTRSRRTAITGNDHSAPNMTTTAKAPAARSSTTRKTAGGTPHILADGGDAGLPSGDMTWGSDPWGPCIQDAASDSPDDCVSTRAVGCRDGSGALVALSLCEQAAMPAMEKVCACEDAVGAPGRAALEGPPEHEADEGSAPDRHLGAWRADDWGPCVHARQGRAAAKGGCQRTRFVSCVDAVGRTVSADECRESTKPRSIGPCDCDQPDDLPPSG